MARLEKIALGMVLAVAATPAFASVVSVPVPAPIAGVGVGAAMLIGMGYRALKRRHGG
jgi:hypothetical protein